MRAQFINEDINFDRGKDPIDAMGLGIWKAYDKGTFISLKEFKDNGGIIKKGREIYTQKGLNIQAAVEFVGYWLEFDETQRVDLIYNATFKSMPISEVFACVKVPTKIKYE
jgi:hypothetical protein